MVGENLRSRSNRRRKKRKNNRNLMIFLALAFLFFTILLSLIVLNKNSDSTMQSEEAAEEEQSNQSEMTEEDQLEVETNEPEEKTHENDQEEQEDQQNQEESKENVTVTELAPEEIDDSNVLKAFVGEWEPIGTNQSGPHTTSYSNGSQDRIEIKRAVSEVTEIAEDNMVEWRVENGGDQKVIATVSDNDETEYYRVYLTWIDNEGWQVNKLEHLKENDKR